MKFHIFQNSGGCHFENRALAELAVKMVQVVKSVQKKGRKKMVTELTIMTLLYYDVLKKRQCL